jgi:mannose-6-phosphate isomerase-like protein (cupin superfamily)
MREIRIRVTELIPGDTVVRVGKTEVNGRFRELKEVQPGQRLVGPRGGRYDVTSHGGEVLVAIVTSTRTLVVRRESFVVVLREWD